VRGGFPEIRGLDAAERIERYASYPDSIIERDAAAIAAVRKPDALRRLTDQMAARTGEELNVAELGKMLRLHQNTVGSYLDILTRLGIVHRLGAWTVSGARREIKAPKLHFLDAGCATALRGEDLGSFGIGGDQKAFGHILESFVFAELEKSLPLQERRWRLYHWRRHPREIDILAEAPGKVIALFEIKAKASVEKRDFAVMDWFLREGPGRSFRGTGFVFDLGAECLSFGAGRIALPVSMLWSFD